MKQTKRLFSLLLVLALLVTTAVPAFAAAVDPGAGSTPGEAITSVKVSDITTPVLGAKPDFDITLTGKGVAFDDEEDSVIEWEHYDLWTDSAYVLDETSIFAPGSYWMYICLEAEEGYQFTEDTKFYFDKEALPPSYEIESDYVSCYWGGDDYAVICLCFIVKPEDPCTVTFAANGGKGTMASVTNAEGLYTLPECSFTAPAGKVFQCWSINGVYTIPGEQILVMEDTIVIAIWADSVTIFFDAGGGRGTMEPITIPSGFYAPLPECGFTAPAGKQFLHWSVEGYRMLPGQWIEEVTEDITVTAVWGTFLTSVNITGIIAPVAGQKANTSAIAVNTENITIDLAHWVKGSSVMNSQTFEAGVTYELLIYLDVAEGYQIADDVAITHDLPGAVASYDQTYQRVDLEYTVPKLTTSYTVSFAANGGSGTMAAVTGVSGSYTLPECGFTAPAGKQFKCWSVDGSEKAPGDTITVTADTTVTALWKQTTIRPFIYTVSFDPGEGTGTMAPEITNGTYTLPKCTFTAPLRSLFLGWVINNSLYNQGDIITVTKDITVTALWVKSSLTGYIVTYNGNGGTGTMTPQMNVSGAFTLPNCGYTAPAGQAFQAYLINGTEYQPGDTITVSAPTIIAVLWKNASTGVTVSGTVTSFNDETGEITLHLIPQGMTEPAYEIIVKGNTASYSFENVLADTYTLRVSKKNHVTREYTVTVGTGAVVQDAKIHLRGDIDGNGKVNVGDTTKVYSHVKKTALITDEYMLLCADIDGNGKINVGDTTKVYAHVKKTSLLW